MTVFAQTIEADSIINGNSLSEKKIYDIQSDDWVIFKYQGQDYLLNFSNGDYILCLKNINCSDNSIKPGFLIKYTNHYRDGSKGGIDFTSSSNDEFIKIFFLVDGKNFNNPFKETEELRFKEFKNSLIKGKSLTIKFYDEEFNPETGEREPNLNREIDFKLINGQLLENYTYCK